MSLPLPLDVAVPLYAALVVITIFLPSMPGRAAARHMTGR